MSNDYKVELDHYNGPLDLLLYLIRRDEVDIQNIPISHITAQYIAYVEVMKHLDPDHIGEFLVLAATLMEIKSRMLLPKPPPEEEDVELIDPRRELVQQLLEYKRFKDAARELGDGADLHAQRFGRLPVLLPAPGEGVDLEYLQIWDLLKAFGRVIQQTSFTRRSHEVLYDDTPIALHATDILDRMERRDGALPFVELFAGRNKSEIIGLFLALLELIRGKRIRAEQQGADEPLVLHLLDSTPILEADIDPTLRGDVTDHSAGEPAPPTETPHS